MTPRWAAASPRADCKPLAEYRRVMNHSEHHFEVECAPNPILFYHRIPVPHGDEERKDKCKGK